MTMSESLWFSKKDVSPTNTIVGLTLNRGVFILLKDSLGVSHFAAILQGIDADSTLNTSLFKLKKDHIVNINQYTAKFIGPKKLVDAFGRAAQSAGFLKYEMVIREEPLWIYFLPLSGQVKIAPIEQPKSIGQSHNKNFSKTKVLIVDDSKTIRNLLTTILSQDSEIEVIGTAEKPSEARAFMAKHKPDVITLDVHMPEMDGVSFLREYLPKSPIPTVMISSISLEESPLILDALEFGAVDYIQKPTFEQLKVLAPKIIETIKLAANAQVKVGHTTHSNLRNAILSKTKIPSTWDSENTPLLVIGSSTGGTEALREILTHLPTEIPPTLIVQHIPPVFSKAFAMRMNEICPFTVTEATHQMKVLPNQVLIAPGGTQMKVVKLGKEYFVEVDPNAPPVNRHKPSVDPLFLSVAGLLPKKTIGIILTGMGSDGSKGLLKLRESGAMTFGQDEATSIVYGMPQAAMKIGAVSKQVPLKEIAKTLQNAWESLQKKIAA